MISSAKYLCIILFIISVGYNLVEASDVNAFPLNNEVSIKLINDAVGAISLAQEAPEAIDVRNFPIQNISSRSQIMPLSGRDADGSLTAFKILSLPTPASGKLYLNNVLVTINKQITLAQAKQLQFEVNSTYIGNAKFTYTVIDNDLLQDLSPATFTIPVVNNASTLVCTGGSLGDNILGDKGTFSAPFIVPSLVSNCVNSGAVSSVSPPQNVGNAHPELTNYTYVSGMGGLNPEGTYSFLKTVGTMATKNCIKGQWVGSDHTGDGGYFMVVNGAPPASSVGKTFYTTKNVEVCPNTLYEFSAYVINVLPGNHSAAVAGSEPNISFFINGQLVSTSGSIKYSDASTGFVPQWVKVGGLWYSGPNTSVDLKIDNATFVASGNDLGLDDISMAICGPEITYPDNDLNPKFCQPGILPLSANVKSSTNTYSYYLFEVNKNNGAGWLPLSTEVQVGSPEIAVDGTYSYTASYGDIPVNFDMNGYKYRLKVATDPDNLVGVTCNIAATKVISVSAIQYPSAGYDIHDCSGITSHAFTPAKAGETWSSHPGNPAGATINQAGQVNGMTADGEYKFILTNSIGCEDLVSVFRYKINDLATVRAALCSPQETYTLAMPNIGYTWIARAGNPANVQIDQVTGVVSGITASGIYQFTLRSDFSDCTADFTITKYEPVLVTVISTLEICLGSTVDITKSIINYDETKYTYSITDPTGTPVMAPFTVNKAGDYKVAASYQGQFCSSETQTIQLIIHPKPGSPLIKIN